MHTALKRIERGLIPASCNIYKYPLIEPLNPDKEPHVPSPDRLAPLENFIISIAHHEVMMLRDSSGATFVHALLIANTDASLALFMKLMKVRPELLVLSHTLGPFEGENSLHVLAVNGRESNITRCLSLIAENLSRDQIREILTAHARGRFFAEIGEPTFYYGETPIAYMASFGCKMALRLLFNDERLNFCVNLNSNQCLLTGFLPIHSVVACGSEAMFDFLISKELPRDKRADPQTLTRPHVTTCPLFQLPMNPLQLSVKLGNQKMFLHVIRRQCCEVQWVWGPTTRYKLDLEGIDSASSFGYAGWVDVMQLVPDQHAHPKAREMLLDKFMDGLLHQLFLSKWRRFASKMHWLMRALDVVLISLQLYIAFEMKLRPDDCDRRYVPWISLILMLLFFAWELLHIRQWWVLNNAKTKSVRQLACELLEWVYSMNMFRKLLAYAISSLGMILVLVNRDELHNSVGTGDEPVWALIGSANFFHFSFFIRDLFVPYQKMGVFALTVERLIADVWVWFVFNGLYVVTFWTTLFILYPRAGDGELPQVPQFNSPQESFKIMWDVGFHVNRFEISYEDLAELSTTEIINWALFALFYYATMVLIVVLLVRLLMAMLTATFNRIRSEAVLEWRLRLARNVLRAELLWPSCFGDTWATPIDPASGKHFIHLTEQAKSGDFKAGRIFIRELPEKEQAQENFQLLSSKLETLEEQLQGGLARQSRFQEQVSRSLVAIQTRLEMPPTSIEVLGKSSSLAAGAAMAEDLVGATARQYLDAIAYTAPDSSGRPLSIAEGSELLRGGSPPLSEEQSPTESPAKGEGAWRDLRWPGSPPIREEKQGEPRPGETPEEPGSVVQHL